ncbi:MAG: AAA family ATPase [Capsulimonas sp.]|uniref:trifunctional serine/threonine-protein kinase/ATP-binding protein/sensor histidine kinase n=1 Tax=Capsulimonas sp. TaxID=2494211 RepID=UPI0032633A4F
MNPFSWFGAGGENDPLEVLWEDGERVYCRTWREGPDGAQHEFLAVLAAGEHPTLGGVNRLTHEYGLKDHLDDAWAVRPLELVREGGQTMLVLESPKGEPLDRLIGPPMEIGRFLRLAVALSAALSRLHGRGLIHKDIKPANVLVNSAADHVWLTGFGVASRLPRERQSPEPPEIIAGTLAYMAPEQTGRMNRSIDSRSDLYSLGVTLYEMLTGSLPFTASDPMELVHCHIARQPAWPNEQVKNVPVSVSAITLKLLAKTAEERYQTAAGAESDLRRCLLEWETQGRIDDFTSGEHDTPDRLIIPEKLYGRELEVAILLTAFDRVVAGGRHELVLVSGYSGIGKSAVVNELHKPLVPPRGLFASGKFDQYKRDIPYATLAQAFQSLIRPLLSKSEEELRQWRDAIREALGSNGSLMVDLVPELKHIIGEQPPAPELPPQDAQRRFQLVFRRFISVFARPEHPLALFLDDLQWLDAATLDLLEDLLTQSDLRHLLLIGAYRDNEVNSTHPLAQKLDAIRQAGAIIQEIVLAPLDREDLGQMLADSLYCESERAAPLAQLIHEKTSGNPFFAIQFISTLADEALLNFDYDRGGWSWDLNRIYAKGYTDNVVDLMVGKLNRLSVETQQALQQFACLGNRAEFDMLRMVYQNSNDEMHDQLWEAVRTGLIFRSENSYRFLHDRVQEAAYSLIPKEQRAAEHLRIGAVLATHSSDERLKEVIFEIVNQLNLGSHLITSVEERERVAELNLIAGQRAKFSTAFASALQYLRAGRSLLTETAWDLNYELIFATECLIAECELLTAEMIAAENRLLLLAERAQTRHDFAIVTRLQLTLYTALDQSDLCVDVFLEFLRRGGTDWSRHPTRDEVLREYERIWTLIGSRQIEDLFDLPLTTNPNVLDTLDVFTEIVHPAIFYNENLSSLVVCRIVSLSLEHGNCDASCFGYVWFAMFAGPRFHNYQDGYRFGQLGFDLVEKRGLTRYQARTYLSFATLTPWTKHAASARNLIHRAFDAASRNGDLTFSAYSWEQLITNCLMAGDPLAEVQSEAENGVAFAKKTGFGLVVEICSTQRALIRTLRGLTPTFGCFNDDDFDEMRTENLLAGNPVLSLAEFFYWTRKLQARFFAGDYAAAVTASRRAQSLVWTASSQVTSADFPFYSALAHAASWDFASSDQRKGHFDALTAHHKQLEVWSEHCPTNFKNRAALVGAEIARIESRILDAEQLYEEAIRSAHANGFVHNEAVASEVAARFYAARGFEKIANAYLRDARYCYLHWGADGKVRHLDQQYPRLEAERPTSDPTSTILAPVEHLDLATVIKVSQAVSGEIVLEKLIGALMRTAIEYAGGERGLLILPQGDEYRIDEYRIVAEATTHSDTVAVGLRQASVTAMDLPESIFHYVLRTKESILLHDAWAKNPFSADDYICRCNARSVLCIPLLKQTRLIGVLYLENNLAPHVFTPARMALLKLLASEAAVSLENTRLYRDLQEREARVRRLVDSNIIGIFIWDRDDRIIDTNEAFIQMIGYSRDDIGSSHIRWRELTPVEWRDTDEQRLADLKTIGIAQPYEKEFLKKDGERVPVLVGAAIFESSPQEGVAFVVDLTDRKRAEAAMRESERRYHEAQTQLALANRVASVGHLSASIAHELNQPLSGIITNASTCLRMLAADPPNVDGACETARRTIRDANRASDVVTRLRSLFANKNTVIEFVDLNEAAREVIALSLSELQRNQVILQSKFADNLPPITGDRVQLQQVILNLLRNAWEAMSGVDDRPRQLVIRTERTEGDCVCLTVQDSGVGLDPQAVERPFEAFYTTKSGGMGIGLSVSRSIIESHQGHLWAAPNDGPGATFSFTIPLESEGVTGGFNVGAIRTSGGTDSEHVRRNP